MVVYADILFLVNFISSYVLLYFLGKVILKARIKIGRLVIASAAGGVAAAVIFSLEIPIAMSYILRILSAIIMVFTAFFEQKRHILRHILWLVCVSAMLIAAMTIFAAVSGRTVGVVIKSGIVYFNLPLQIFLPMFVLSYITVSMFMKFLQNRSAKKRYIITVTYGDKTITVPALFDSGNLLKEPVTGKCVSILEWEQARKLLGAEFDLPQLYECAEGMKLWAVPYHSIGNKSGVVFAFLADRIDVPDEKKSIENTFIGLYDGRLSENNEYNALLNAALL